MATADLKSFLEDRLRALEPTIDLEAGSPAQVQFIEPVITRLGTDPFETDIETFLLDRFRQEFPDVYTGDPSVVNDLFIKPLRIMLEPLKREIQSIKRNQSLANPTVLSDDDADALIANIFEERSTGGFAGGVARIFFTNPTNIGVELSNRFYTAGGLSFFPTSPVSITAEEMVFNKSGALYFMDLPVQAESAGSDYNITADQLVGVDNVFGSVKVSNPRAFQSGSSGVDTPTFIAQSREALTERSLVTRRGASARLSQVFQGEVRAIQVIGAKDAEMQRDLLVATSPGHQWLTGTVSVFDSVAFVQVRTVEGDVSDAPVVGDELYVYLDAYSNSAAFAGLSQSLRLVRLTVEEVIFGPMPVTVTPYQVAYLVRWSGSFPSGVVLPNPVSLEGGFARKGTVRVSSLPDIGTVSLSVPNQEIHVYGHSDIYVRPVLQPTSKAVLSGLADLGVLGNTIQSPTFVVERSTLQTTALSNVVTDALGFNFEASGVVAGDTLIIDEGADAGSYVIGKVVTTSAYLTVKLTATNVVGTRFRVQKALRIDPFEPRIPKFPFGSVLANDLSTTIGSNLFTLSTNDVLLYGAVVGDTVRIKTGTELGDFTIQGFDAVLGGRGLIVDRPATATGSSVQFEIFTALEKIARPLVRVKEILLLDSSKQSTGVTIPPADPVAIVPTGAFASAQVRGASARSTGVVLPDMTTYLSSSINVAAGSGDRRYSLGYEPFTGIYRDMQFADATHSEFNFDAAAFGQNSYFMAVVEDVTGTTNFPPIDPKAGESLTIHSGPNKGSYLIKNVYKFRHPDVAGTTFRWTYFINIYGEFPTDPLRQIVSFLDQAETAGAAGAGVTKIANSGAVTYPDFFTSTYDSLGTKMRTAFTFYGIGASPTSQEIQNTIIALTQVPYEWGEPAHGVLRSYFLEPTLFEQHTDKHTVPTTYQYKTESGDYITFRPEPNRYSKLEIVPARQAGDTALTELPRDSNFATAATVNLTDSTNPSLFVAGVQPNDVLSVHQETFFHGADKSRQTAIQTVAGSNQITAPSASAGPFTSSMVGYLFFIEEGSDIGGYRVSKFIDSSNLLLDKQMTETTPAIVAQGTGSWGNAAGVMTLTDAAAFNFTSYLNYYVTLYGMNFTYEGSYKIKTILAADSVELEGATFPLGFPQGTALWVLTAAPATAPAPVRSGTELFGVRPIRMYQGTPTEKVISAVGTDPSVSTATIPIGTTDGYNQPYRIYRLNLRRITPTEMAAKVDGSLVYFDTEVVSLQPQPSANISKDSFLQLDIGCYTSLGYRFVVADNTLTYSTKEQCFLDLPTKVLPVGSSDSPDNYLSLSGLPLQITYEQAEIVRLFQAFLDSAQDRVTAANMLARHFLPAYVSYDATYFGGSAASVIAKDVLAYIDTIPVETPIDVSVIENFITRRGGNPETPTMVVTVIHDWDRKMWMEHSENKLGGTETKVPYNGTPRVSYFVPGPDVSGKDPLPAGERINLVRG